MKRFKEKLDEQNAKIIELQSKISIQDNALQKLETTCDNNEHVAVVCVYVPIGFNIMKIILILQTILKGVVIAISVKFDTNEIGYIILVSPSLTLTQSRKSGQL